MLKFSIILNNYDMLFVGKALHATKVTYIYVSTHQISYAFEQNSQLSHHREESEAFILCC